MLLAKGYHSTGKWNLAQVCNHINEWIRFPVDGYPKVPMYCRPIFWALRSTIMPGKLKQYIADKSFPAGKPTMQQTVFAPNYTTDQEAVNKLAATIRRMDNYRGSLHPSPLFGAMDREKHLGLQLIHSAHHLGFLVPKNS
jgi:hypothetical protein